MTRLAFETREPEFLMGGPAYRLMQLVGLIRGAGPSIGRRFGAFLLITWVPLLALSLLEGKALGQTPQESFLLDLATYARFFLAVPLIFLAEAVVGPRLKAAGRQFIEGNFVHQADVAVIDAAVDRVRRRREALLPEIIILAIALIGSWYFSLTTLSPGSPSTTWTFITDNGGTRTSLAGLWYYFVAVPLLQFLMYRWLWRLIIWTLFLYDVACLRLNLVVNHPDRAGGLGFLGNAHVSLTVFAVASSCVLSAHVAFQIYFTGAAIESFKGLFTFYLFLVEFVCLGPLLVFVPQLARARVDGMRRYSILSDRYNRAFERKWLAADAPSDDAFLGSADIQSLADLGSSFDIIREMKPFPFTRQQVLQIAVIASLPGLPLIFLVMPLGQLVQLLTGALL